MNIPTKQLQNGFSLPVLGAGTWGIGGKMIRSTTEDETSINSLQEAIKLGITHFDTAEVYAEGHTEEIVGQAIQGFDRNKLFICSKLSTKHLATDDVNRFTKEMLTRLQTNYLDLLLIHYPNPYIPIQETIEAMNRLIEEGLVKNIGVSNFTVERLQEAQKYSKNKIVVNQLHYNLMIREIERKGILEYCQKNDIMIIAWRPLQKAILVQENPLLDQICQKYNKTRAQIALKWLISQQNVVTITKMQQIPHIQENLQLFDWELSTEDIEMLRNDFPNQTDVSDSVILI